MWARSSHQSGQTPDRESAGEWWLITPARLQHTVCCSLISAAKGAPSHIWLDSKTALGRISNKQLCYLCKVSGAGCFCMHGRISLSLDSLGRLKWPLKHDALHPAYKKDSYFSSFLTKEISILQSTIIFHLLKAGSDFFRQEQLNYFTKRWKNEKVSLVQEISEKGNIYISFPVVDLLYWKFYLQLNRSASLDFSPDHF